MKALLDGKTVDYWKPVAVKAGSTLKLAVSMVRVTAATWQSRVALICLNTWAVEATFTLGQFGGHGGRALQVGDVLRLHRNSDVSK